MNNVQHKAAFTLVASIKDMDAKKGIVIGYAASFNEIDSDGDIIMPGAFTKTIRELGPNSTQPRIKHLLNHKPDQPIGNPLVLKEDAKGLHYESQIGTHTLGQDFLKMVESGLISEHSIGFNTIRQQQDANKKANIISEVKLWEFSSLTAWGANGNTPILGIKQLQTVNDRIEKLKSAIKNGTFTDGGFEFLLDELNYLQKAYKDISTKPEPPKATTSPELYLKALQQFTI